MDAQQRLTIVVRGEVQGVGFRAWVQQQAGSLGLVGSAVNLMDGRVEIVVEGTGPDCTRLLEVVHGDRSPGRVRGVDVSWSEARGDLRGFRTG